MRAARARRASADDRGGAEPGSVVAVHVDRGEPHLGVLEQRLGGGGEVGQARADGEDEVGLAGQGVGGRGALQPDAAQQPPVAVLDGALAGEGLGHGDAGGAGERLQLAGGVGVDDPAAGDQQRPAGPRQQPGDLGHLLGVGQRPADGPVALVEQLGRVVEGLRLDVLGQGQDHGAGRDRVGQDPHGLGQGGQELLGAGDAVEEPGQRAEGVVGAHVGLGRVLELLEDRALAAGRVGVAGEQQDREPVDGGDAGPGDHVERPGADRGGDGQGGPAAGRLGEGGGRVHQGLLVAALDERHPVVELVEGLAHAGDVAVAEDAEGGRDEPAAVAVGHRVLGGQEPDDGLGDRQAHGPPVRSGHGWISLQRRVTRGGRGARPS